MRLIFAVLAGAMPMTAQAQQASQPRPSYEACLDGAQGRDGVILTCIQDEASFQEDRLNATYRATMARLTPPGRLALRDLQRGWLNKRYQRCIRENAEAGDGTLGRWLVAMCALGETMERTDWLARYPRK